MLMIQQVLCQSTAKRAKWRNHRHFALYTLERMATERWTHRFVARWRPRLAFYEKRIEILRALEADGSLSFFRVLDDQVVAHLGNADLRVSATDESVAIEALKPGVPLDRLFRGAEIVLDAIEPSVLRRFVLQAQYLAPIDQDYDDARRVAVQSMTSLGDNVHPRDAAVLIDAQLSSPPATFHAEYGVAERREIPIRLSRAGGRLASHNESDVSPGFWDEASIPEVAGFCDALVSADRDVTADPTIGAFVELHDALLSATDEAVDSLLSPFYSGAKS